MRWRCSAGSRAQGNKGLRWSSAHSGTEFVGKGGNGRRRMLTEGGPCTTVAESGRMWREVVKAVYFPSREGQPC